jgi:hypothetical protein
MPILRGDVVAMTCVSLLSDTLKLYFEALRVRVVGFDFGGRREEAFRQGFVKAHLGALGGISGDGLVGLSC